MRQQLHQHIQDAGLPYEELEKGFKLPCDNKINVYTQVYRGVAWIYSYTGGMPGETPAAQGLIAMQLLQRNWDVPLGRLSLDGDNDLVWESQVPCDFLTPDYLAIFGATAAAQVADFIGIYGQISFNG